MDKSAPSMLKATVIGGGAAGVAAALPVVGALNCLCGSLFIGGGFLAAYLYSRDCGKAGVDFGAGSGAVVGLVSGLFYSIVMSIGWHIQMRLVDIDLAVEQMEQFNPDPEAADMATRIIEYLGTGWGALTLFFAILLVAAAFSTIGGVIGGAVFKVEAPPSAPSTQGPSLPPPDTAPRG